MTQDNQIIEELEKKDAEIARLKHNHNGQVELNNVLKEHCEAYLTRLTDADDEVAQLRAEVERLRTAANAGHGGFPPTKVAEEMNQLRADNAEQAKDSARLDWLGGVTREMETLHGIMAYQGKFMREEIDRAMKADAARSQGIDPKEGRK